MVSQKSKITNVSGWKWWQFSNVLKLGICLFLKYPCQNTIHLLLNTTSVMV